MKKYFAYGSNLFFKQMGERCPEHRKIGKGVSRGILGSWRRLCSSDLSGGRVLPNMPCY
ncbi:MAG: hypothetical protein ACOYJV_01510 [Aminivibrio sp.]